METETKFLWAATPHELHFPLRLTPIEFEMLKNAYSRFNWRVDKVFKVKRLGKDRGFIIEGLRDR